MNTLTALSTHQHFYAPSPAATVPAHYLYDFHSPIHLNPES